MSVDRELQFLAMLEGHELEKELLDIVSIIIISFSRFSKENLFISQIWPLVRVQLICNRNKEVRFQVSCDNKPHPN